MKTAKEIGLDVENWIAQEELPVKANLKVIRRNDPDYGFTEDEIEERNEFIRCCILSEFALLTLIPKQDADDDFFIFNWNVADPEYSAFNTHDFQRTQRPFNQYGYAIKMILERVRELAIMHSSISESEGRLETYQRYLAFVDRKFRNRLNYLVSRYKEERHTVKACEVKRKIAELNLKIQECKCIWERYAPPENWDT